jgi:hypothetical protein
MLEPRVKRHAGAMNLMFVIHDGTANGTVQSPDDDENYFFIAMNAGACSP